MTDSQRWLYMTLINHRRGPSLQWPDAQPEMRSRTPLLRFIAIG
jgi:hypothetical protein